METLTLVIGNKNYSSWSLRPWLYLKQYKIPFREVKIPLYTEGYKKKIQEYSPSGKVPYLMDGQIGVWDSLAIMEYLGEKYYRGWPLDPRAKATARSVCAEMHSGFFAMREHLPMNCRKTFKAFIPPEEAVKDISRIKEIWNRYRTEYASKGPWLFGEFTLADCVYAPVVMRFHTYNIPLNDTEAAYVKTVRSHKAIQEWIQSSHDEEEIIENYEVKSD